MLTQGNVKLGPRIWQWSLPVVDTCPGASPTCLAACYARRGRLLMLNRNGVYVRRLEKSRRQSFVQWMTLELADKMVEVLRWHVSGDFYDAAYVRKWTAIVRASPATTFYGYTRSWRVPEIRTALQTLSRQSNAQLWLSADRDTGRPRAWKGVRTCYMSLDDSDLPPYAVDLVFRDSAQSVMKRTDNGSLICPYENGVTATTCSRCKFCWRDVQQAQRALATARCVTA